jgi:hypothetical protein
VSTLIALWPMLLATLATLGLGAGGVFAARLAWVRAFLERVKAERRAVVLEVEQVYVAALRRAREADSPGGTKLTEGEAEAAKTAAVDRLIEMLGIGAITRALRILGLPPVPDFVRRWAITQVESEVAAMKAGRS